MELSKRAGIGIGLAALAALTSASGAAASETIGRLAPAPALSCAGSTLDLIEPDVSSGTGYVVPPVPPAVNLVISSWSNNASTGPPEFPGTGPMILKAYRQTMDPDTFRVVGHDTQPLIPGTLNTFRANISVQVGDVIGTTTAAPATSACTFPDAGGGVRASVSNLADGEAATFGGSDTSKSLNVTAVVSPSNSFTISKGKPRRKSRTVVLTVDAPNAGDLALSGNGVKADKLSVAGPGRDTLLVRATGKKRKKLNRTGKVKVQAKVTFAPIGGDPRTESLTVKLLS
jgi:hypothetical protein